jgi:hypothetical protein
MAGGVQPVAWRNTEVGLASGRARSARPRCRRGAFVLTGGLVVSDARFRRRVIRRQQAQAEPLTVGH